MYRFRWPIFAMLTLPFILGLVVYLATVRPVRAAETARIVPRAAAQAAATAMPADHMSHHDAGETSSSGMMTDTIASGSHTAQGPAASTVVTPSTPASGTTAMPDMPDMTGNEMAGMEHAVGGAMGGHDMGPVASTGVPAATESSGGQPLAYREEAGVKVFELTARPVLWPILQGVTVTAWTYNGVVPGPLIRVTEGDRVRVVVKNELPEATAIHWHGVLVPNVMDGVVPVTQPAIQPGEVYTYEFEAKPVGSFMYHSHVDTDKQIALGLYAPLIIDPAEPAQPVPDVDVSLMLSEWRVMEGQTYPAMPLAGMEPNYFTLNGKAFPATETITVKKGDRVRIRLMGIGQFVHPMHLHGMPFQIAATDGYPVPEAARLTKDTISVAPGERYDIEFVADAVGTWMLHCHIPHHITNDGLEPGGLVTLLKVVE